MFFVVPNAHYFSLIRSCTIKHHGTDTSFLLEVGETRKTNRGGGFSTTWFYSGFFIAHFPFVQDNTCKGRDAHLVYLEILL